MPKYTVIGPCAEKTFEADSPEKAKEYFLDWMCGEDGRALIEVVKKK